MFYVYTYTDPFTKAVIYVGKGHSDRDQYHIRNRNIHYNKGFGEHLQKIVDLGDNPQILRVANFTCEQNAYDVERRLIEHYGRIDQGTGTLYNRTPGGEGYGRTGTTWSEDFKQDRLIHNASNPRGATYTQYTMLGEVVSTGLKTIDLTTKGYSKSDLNAIRSACNGKRFSVKGYRWTRCGEPLAAIDGKGIIIEQLEVSGDVCATHCSIQSASRTTKINASDINQCILGNNVTAGGFMWRVRGSKVAKARKCSSRPVDQLDLCGQLVHRFGTMTEAAVAAATSVEEIGRVASGQRRSAGGFIWEYVD